MSAWRVLLVLSQCTLSVALFMSTRPVLGQVAMPAVRLERAFGIVAAEPVDEDRKERAEKWVRGLIQNELRLIASVCKPNLQQSQKLVNIAESEWRSKMATTILAYREGNNQRIPTDFEARSERLVQSWVTQYLDDEQAALWAKEIESRFQFRRRLVIGQMVMDVERKLGLTASQMDEIAVVLQERWKDSWWSMYRAGTLPETKFSWISKILSDTQRTMGNDRTSQMIEHFIAQTVVDLPSLPHEVRFELNGIKSVEAIPIEAPQPAAQDESNRNDDGEPPMPGDDDE